MLVSSVLENCIITLFFFHTGVATLEANLGAVRHIRMRQIMFLKSEKTTVLEILKFYRFSINYNGIIRNDIEAFIQFYRVVLVIPHKYNVQIYKNQ